MRSPCIELAGWLPLYQYPITSPFLVRALEIAIPGGGSRGNAGETSPTTWGYAQSVPVQAMYRTVLCMHIMQ